jgi:hypothetical protein
MTPALEGGEGLTSRPGRSFNPGKEAVPIVQEEGWAPGPVWTGAESLAPTGIQSPDRPARSQSLYPYTTRLTNALEYHIKKRHRIEICTTHGGICTREKK